MDTSSAEANYASRDNIVVPAVLDPDGTVVYSPERHGVDLPAETSPEPDVVEVPEPTPVAEVQVVPTVE